MTADTRNYSIEQDGKVTPYPDPQEVDDEGFTTIYDSQAEERKNALEESFILACLRFLVSGGRSAGDEQFIEEAE